MALTVTILYPSGDTVPGHGGAYAWGTVTSDKQPIRSVTASIADDASGGAIAGSTAVATLGHPLRDDGVGVWMVMIEKAYNGGKKVKLTVTATDSGNPNDTKTVSFTFGAH
jgi:hypothetical protein